MQVFDEINNKFRDSRYCVTAVVKHIHGQIVFGYVGRESKIDNVLFYSNGELNSYFACLDKLKDNIAFSNKSGYYMSTVDCPAHIIAREMFTKGKGKFPYNFDRRYEACENFDRFNGKQEVLDTDKSYCLTNYLKYSFGLEFETSQGYIPEDICFRDGLIPLRDGSISGIEYSTVVLSGNKGISLLEQQLESLKKYTDFNKECSLHIHMGGFPLDGDKLYNLYILCKRNESELASLVPAYTFNTEMYKDNRKSYCNKLPAYRNFDQMYEHIVGRKFFNDFTQPHPADLKREAKWHIHTRYYFVNFVNMLCYNVNKTIEFRFLRPTYNFQKIILWMYIFNALLLYAEKAMATPSDSMPLPSVICTVYPKELAERILVGLEKLKVVKNNQESNGDLIGRDVYIEEEIFSEDLGI